jgi:hypothetical protein
MIMKLKKRPGPTGAIEPVKKKITLIVFLDVIPVAYLTDLIINIIESRVDIVIIKILCKRLDSNSDHLRDM